MNCTVRVVIVVLASIGIIANADDPPQIFLDKNPRIIAYQLKRLTNAQLLSLERKTSEAKYKPIYEAILARKGVERQFRQEAVEGLVKLNQSDTVLELLTA